jgi:hypothetical protein
MSHFVWMVLYALILALFFSALWRRERPAQLRLFAQIFGGLVGGAIVLGWLIYFFPSGPPTVGP